MANNRHSNERANEQANERGFTLLELVVVVAVMLVIAALAIPNFQAAMHTARLKGTVSDFSSLLQTQRIRAVDDDLYYSSYVLAGASQAFVDIYPQSAVGASGHGGTQTDPRDPIFEVSAEIVQKPVGGAPNTASLKALFLPANAAVALYDGNTAANPITFGPRGLPCSAAGGNVCKTSVAAGDVAYWAFFQNSVTKNWGAITVTPAGRIRRWIFTGGTTGTWVNY